MSDGPLDTVDAVRMAAARGAHGSQTSIPTPSRHHRRPSCLGRGPPFICEGHVGVFRAGREWDTARASASVPTRALSGSRSPECEGSLVGLKSRWRQDCFPLLPAPSGGQVPMTLGWRPLPADSEPTPAASTSTATSPLCPPPSRLHLTGTSVMPWARLITTSRSPTGSLFLWPRDYHNQRSGAFGHGCFGGGLALPSIRNTSCELMGGSS